MTALNGTIPFTKMANISILVACNLYLYMAWLLHEFLHVNTIVPECSRSLDLRCAISPVHVSLFPHDAHALASTACRCLEDDRVAHVLCKTICLLQALQQSFSTWYHRNARFYHRLFGRNLISHCADHFRGRSDKFYIMVITYLRKSWILGQEAVPGMNGICIGNFNCSHEVCNIEIGITALRFANTHSLISKLYVK